MVAKCSPIAHVVVPAWGSNTGSQSVTVPSDCVAMKFGTTWWDGGSGKSIASVTWNTSETFTIPSGNNIADGHADLIGAAQGYLLSPTTGTANIEWDWTGTGGISGGGGDIFITFLKEADVTAIGATDIGFPSGGFGSCVASVATNADDLVVGHCIALFTAAGVTGTRNDILDDYTNGNDSYDVGTAAGTGGTVSFNQNDTGVYSAVMCMAFLNEATGVTLAPVDITQAHSLDVATLTQHNVIQPDGVNHAHSLDASTISSAVSLVPADIDQAQTIDASALVQHHVLTAAELLHGVTLDAATLTQHHSIVANDLSQSVTLDGSALTQHHVIAPDAIDQAQTLDVGALVTAGTLSPDELNHAQTVDASSLTQHHSLVVDELLQSMTLDASTLVQHYQIAPDAIDQAQTLDATSISTINGLVPDPLDQSQTIDIAVITQHHAISPAGISQAHSLDAGAIDNGLGPDIVQIIGTEVTLIRTLADAQTIERILTQTGKLS